ncbi:MAG: V4R domain-containing protein [Candidatus Jordarchaeales archaeon]
MAGRDSTGSEEAGFQVPGELNPLDLGRLTVLDRGQKWCGVVLETAFGKDVVRRLGEIAENLGIVIRFIQVSMVKAQEPSARAVAFLDFSNAIVTPKEALELVSKQEFVKKARIIYPSRTGVLSDDYFFPLVLGRERIVVFRRRTYESLFKGIRERFGTAGEVMLYYVGFNIGYQTYSDYADIVGSEKTEAIVELAKTFLRTMGWGIVDIVEMDLERGIAQVRVYESFECEIGRGSEAAYGHFSRGLVAGFFTRLFDREVKAVETMCIAKGDPFCEFTIRA